MSSLADLPELVGFFSYSRRDDERAAGALSALRKRIHDELGLQLGRDVRLWQDTAAIPHGTLWGDEIKRAIAESAFFIPIVTPSSVASPHCGTEFELFLAREAELGRKDLIFPILYIRLPALGIEDQRRQNDVLEIIHVRQYADWTKIRQRDVASFEVAKQIEDFCQDIVEALLKPWVSPEERQRRVEAEALKRADEERQRRAEAEAQRMEDERRRQEEEAKRVAEVERGRKIAAEAEHQRLEREAVATREAEERARRAAAAEAERQRQERDADTKGEAEAKLRAEQERAFTAAKRANTAGAVEHGTEPRKPWQPSWRPLLMAGVLAPTPIAVSLNFVAAALAIDGIDLVLAHFGNVEAMPELGYLLLGAAEIGIAAGTISRRKWARYFGIAVCAVSFFVLLSDLSDTSEADWEDRFQDFSAAIGTLRSFLLLIVYVGAALIYLLGWDVDVSTKLSHKTGLSESALKSTIFSLFVLLVGSIDLINLAAYLATEQTEQMDRWIALPHVAAVAYVAFRAYRIFRL